MTAWCIWLHRNNKVFNRKNSSVNMVAEDIKVSTFWWMTRRAKRAGLTLDSYLHD
ncbi:hypothetical protein HanHA300_Chr17g0653241 [Helianthus annuus]|nr:hypothetical protein HanHA300_Chr17g0653241 [Helianthus annuus]KAJ0447451.1 hypothetical protein HanHA89_Chr17g0705551 [Helianthus annuus]KAJ0632330.1 hypothetical protein HanLR1_Chr17g0663951 [Helianthus annuus]